MTRLSRKLSSFFIASEIIPAEDKEVYEYSFEILISTLISFTALLIFSLLTDTVLYTSIYLVGFIPLRLVAGGYHAKNHLRCFIILMCTYSLFLLLLGFLPTELVMYVTVAVIVKSLVLVFVFAPSEDENKPVAESKKPKFEKASRISIVCYAVIALSLAMFIPDGRFAFALVLGNSTIAISLLANYVKQKKKKY